MKTFKAKLLRDLTYIGTCSLKKGSIVNISQLSARSNWILDTKSNQKIKVFNHDFEVV